MSEITSTATPVIKSFRTIVEMLMDRGYDINVDKNVMSESITKDFNKTTFNIVLANNIHVVYAISNKFKYVDVKKYLQDADNEGAQLVILVVNDSMTNNILKSLKEHKMLEIHQLKALQINISHHELVPEHYVIRDQEEIKRIIKDFCLKSKHQLPVILKTDAMARYLGLKSGDVVRITRPSPTAGLYDVYRVCV
jgi:DNA-directed RNA polymerase I, II, and III subunit RPABC1